jgi:hypothetical protein
MNINKLDFILVGAQKCATSWLFYCLSEHPELILPKKKLEVGYIGGKMFLEKGEDWFFNRFSMPTHGQLLGDVSVDYLYDINSADACKKYTHSNTKFIASLRHPVERAISSYFWYVRRKELPLMSLNEGLLPLLDSSPGFPVPLDGIYEQIARRGCYAIQIEQFTKIYGADKFYIATYDQISSSPKAVIKDIYSYLNVSPDFIPMSLSSRPKKNAHLPILTRLERVANKKILAKISNYMNQTASFLGVGRKPELSRKIANRLQELYAPCIEETREVITQLPSSQRPSDQDLQSLWSTIPQINLTND